jgi:hypothetical protein
MLLLKEEFFETSLYLTNDDYFPEFIKNALNKYLVNYKTHLHESINEIVHFTEEDIIISKIVELTQSIQDTVNLYYEGNFFKAIETFNNCLDKIFYDDIKILNKITAGNIFYRARRNEDKHFSKRDLFHVAFENRHIVSTNRYSLPGFPALYIADSTYTCWEEFDRYRLRDLWFSKVENKSDLSVIEINRYMDLVQGYFGINTMMGEEEKLPYVLSYLATFPLTLACTIKVKHPNANFKPEYIIPQLLVQYISKKEDIDGIRFPSTKIDYSKIRAVKSFNYVFPVKTNKRSGLCDKLISQFHISEPTSLELEELIFNSFTTYIGNSSVIPLGDIELINGKKSIYKDTSFGKLEISLRNRKTSQA